MKETGMFRKIDELGRIVIPKEIRRALNLKEKDAVEFFLENEGIVLKKYADRCVFCGQTEVLHKFMDQNICDTCYNIIKQS